MRKVIVALALGLATVGTAFAEVDGKAAASGGAAAALRAGANPVDVPTIRAVIGAALEGGLSPDERDLIEEIASGGSIAVSADGQTILLQPAEEKAKAIASLVLAPPNLHTLWHKASPAPEQLIELAQLGPAMHQRIYVFIGNQLDDAWKNSTLLDANAPYAPYQGALTVQWKAFETLPADAETRAFAYDLLTTGIAYGIEKAKAESREPPKDFLYAWLAQPGTKERFVAGKPPRPPPAAQ